MKRLGAGHVWQTSRSFGDLHLKCTGCYCEVVALQKPRKKVLYQISGPTGKCSHIKHRPPRAPRLGIWVLTDEDIRAATKIPNDEQSMKVSLP